VLVDGRIVKRDGKLVAYDVDKIVRDAKASALRIRTAAGGRLNAAGKPLKRTNGWSAPSALFAFSETGSGGAPGKGTSRDGCARRSRCCLRTSNAFLSSIGSDYEDRMVRAILLAATAQNLRKMAKLIPAPDLRSA
jgi:hypothetical protein